MNEIDVTYCKFVRLNDVCASPINTQERRCSKIPIQMCYYKQLQQAKQYNYDTGQQLIRMSQEVQQLKESNKTLNERLLILNNRLDEYKRIYGEL